MRRYRPGRDPLPLASEAARGRQTAPLLKEPLCRRKPPSDRPLKRRAWGRFFWPSHSPRSASPAKTSTAGALGTGAASSTWNRSGAADLNVSVKTSGRL